jgi:predicted GH43/DUF377 family glycosyl hydrolase
MQWIKKGQILDLANSTCPEWISSHAQNPVAISLNTCVRVFFNSRKKLENDEQIAYPGFVDLDKNDFSKILGYSENPLMELGDKGCFDEFGMMSSSIVKNKDELWMYYVGWTRMQSTPYNWAIGLAVSTDNGQTFTKKYKGPILGASKNEPYLQNGCTVKIINGQWHMWYSTGQEWIIYNGKQESRYAIAHATSNNGIDWERNGKTILPFLSNMETQTTPTIFYKKGKYHMLFSYRNSIDFRKKDGGYRIGYAKSSDLKNWKRDDLLVGINISKEGWDSEMVAYPHVTEIDGKTVMFYCGNYFGRDGFGYALLKGL